MKTTITTRTPKIVIEQDVCLSQQRIADAFFDSILGMCGGLVTDLSELSDYCLSGEVPQGVIVVAEMTASECYTAWDNWVVDRIRNVYGITIASTKIPLTQLFYEIEKNAKKSTH